jgi:hypothetical protein
MPIKSRTEPRTNKDAPHRDLVDNRGGTFDPGPNSGTHEIYTNPDNLPEGLRASVKEPWDPLRVGVAGTRNEVYAPSCGPW